MGAITYFEKDLRGSDWGEPTDRETAGVAVRIVEFHGFAHVETRPTGDPEATRHIALFSLSEAKEFRDSLDAVIRRVEGLGEM